MKRNEKEIIKEIEIEIAKIQPFMMSEGGILEFIKYEDGIAYVRLGGACASCGLIDITLKEGIEQIITSAVPEVKKVKRID